MSYGRKHLERATGKPRRAVDERSTLQNVISLRISDQEKKMLEKLTKSTDKNISDIMREAMDLWKSKRRSLCPDI